jgi:hypothetical protein
MYNKIAINVNFWEFSIKLLIYLYIKLKLLSSMTICVSKLTNEVCI